jgi:hypothetical protein
MDECLCFFLVVFFSAFCVCSPVLLRMGDQLTLSFNCSTPQLVGSLTVALGIQQQIVTMSNGSLVEITFNLIHDTQYTEYISFWYSDVNGALSVVKKIDLSAFNYVIGTFPPQKKIHPCPSTSLIPFFLSFVWRSWVFFFEQIFHIENAITTCCSNADLIPPVITDVHVASFDPNDENGHPLSTIEISANEPLALNGFFDTFASSSDINWNFVETVNDGSTYTYVFTTEDAQTNEDVVPVSVRDLAGNLAYSFELTASDFTIGQLHILFPLLVCFTWTLIF